MVHIRNRPLLGLSIILLASSAALLVLPGQGLDDPQELLEHKPGDNVLVDAPLRPLSAQEARLVDLLGFGGENATVALDSGSDILVAAVLDGAASPGDGPWHATVLAVRTEPPVVVLALQREA